MTEDRLTALQKKLARKNLDALLVTGRENIRYLIGFSGTAGILLVNRQTDGESFFLTDSRYTLQAAQEVRGAGLKITSKPLPLLRQLVKRLNIKRLGFEPQQLMVAAYRQIEKSLPGAARLIATQDLIERLRLLKDTQEVHRIKRAIQIAGQAFKAIKDDFKPGISEKALAAKLEYELKLRGSEKTPFEIIVASGERSAMPHGVASDKKLNAGDMVVVDFGASVAGYNSDISRTLIIGKLSAEQKKIYQLVANAQAKGIEAIKPGVTAAEIDKITRSLIEEAGYGKYFSHSTGHGVGMQIHEAPRISYNDKTVLKAGMVFTMEPGIYLPGTGGVRIEDMVLVTSDGCQVLSAGLF